MQHDREIRPIFTAQDYKKKFAEKLDRLSKVAAAILLSTQSS